MTRLIDDAPEGVNTPEFSVSELSGAVKRTVEGAFGHVRVRGEIGRVSRPRSGHVYLDLKDDRAVLSGIIWKGTAGRLATPPEEGMEVIATGRLTTFPGQSKYQIVIEDIAPAGVGALMAMLEKRRKALAAEGLFDAERKRTLPFLPTRIGVVTSPSGAVIRDILHRLAERFPVHVLVWPVAVQGANCAPEVAAAIHGFSTATGALRPDLVIVARGGGSVEDLWGFNEELVVRATADCTIPLISAVGHETDTTLIDHAADRRAPTPSAAAEIAVPVRGELAAQIADLEARRLRALDTLVRMRRQRLTDLARALPRPDQMLAERRQRLDLAALRLPDPARIVSDARLALGRPADRLAPALTSRTAAARLRLAHPVARLTPALLTDRTVRLAERLTDRAARLSPAMDRAARDARGRLTALARMLGTLSYKGTLARGYAVVRDASGAVLPGPADAGSSIEIEWAGDQRRRATVDGAPETTRKPRTRKAKTASDQGSLF